MVEITSKQVFLLAALYGVAVAVYAPMGGVMTHIGTHMPTNYGPTHADGACDLQAYFDAPDAPTATVEALTLDGDACLALLREQEQADMTAALDAAEKEHTARVCAAIVARERSIVAERISADNWHRANRRG